jgi:hypothetical protein
MRAPSTGKATLLIASVLLAAPAARAQEGSASERLKEAQQLYQAGQYFKSARYAFNAIEGDPRIEAEAYSWITLGLMRAKLPNAASYFFVKTLQSGSKPAIRRVLTQTEPLLMRVGPDLLRNFLVRHTAYEDYDAVNRSSYLFSLGKEALLAGDANRAVGYLNGISDRSPVHPFALQLRGTAHALAGKNEQALEDFRQCDERAAKIADAGEDEDQLRRQQASEAEDLQARCRAGYARTLYQMDRFEDADRAYDRIPKESLVWPDILFEHAWASFGRAEYNRTLGKLVSYKSPALEFVWNPEIDVLRAQAYLALCLYDDANEVVNEFNARYAQVGEEVKKFVEANASNLGAFHELGKKALSESLYTRNGVYRMVNRFARGPYFQNLVSAERSVQLERAAAQRFGSSIPGAASGSSGRGFPGFLEQVLSWRERTIRQLGGAFIKNSLLDHHAALIADFEKTAFIKLEMLRRAKERLMYKRELGLDRTRGSIEPSRRDDQYYWSFNGEFWNDELGDYVFGLESECRG